MPEGLDDLLISAVFDLKRRHASEQNQYKFVPMTFISVFHISVQ
jgi:hypothetical protein